jgi:acetyl-CoA C-acetyltransferase
MRPVFFVDAKRTPIGRFLGGLKNQTAVDLATTVGDAMLPASLRAHIDHVVLGQVLPAACGMNIARQTSLRLGIPHSVPAFVVNMVCGSGMKAIALAADMIASGECDLILAGGAESMSNAPHYQRNLRSGQKLGDAKLEDAIFTDGLTDPTLNISMGETAERLAASHGITRAEQDEFALRSQTNALAAREAFRREIIPVQTRDGLITDDEHPRADTTIDKLAKLKPAFRPDGSITAGNASGINDGAALVLLASERALKQHDLKARACLLGCATSGCDPAEMGIGPVAAIRRLCARAGVALNEWQSIEINEAFAAQALACAKDLQLDLTKLNPRGGGIALGHPVGASGARVLVTLLHSLEDQTQHRGLASLCIGGGMGIAMGIEITS